MQTNNAPELDVGTVANSVPPDDLSREVYGVLGIPVDAIDMAHALRSIELAAAGAAPFLISTANLNYLLASQSDAEFRESLLLSDLCTADGMPIVWVARLLGVPIKERVAGSDLFEVLNSRKNVTRRLKVFLFGGAEGAAAAACKKLNAAPGGMTCAGSYYPGYCAVDEMSSDAILNAINSSNADFLAAALGARKGQVWLLRNHDRLRVPVRAHLGAVINFQAGTVKRAPARLRKWGLEWLWRIKEEPELWRRYLGDGIMLLQVAVTQIIPLIVLSRWHRLKRESAAFLVERTENHKSVTLSINGAATAHGVGNAMPYFRDAAAAGRDVVINFTNTPLIDARFLGLLLMLNKILMRRRLHLTFTGVSPAVDRLFRLNGFGFLLRTKTESVA